MTTLGIISDTHGLLNETVLAVQLFRERGVPTVIHCGDIGSSAVAKAFQGLETHFVLGNVDGDGETLRLAIEETGNHFHGWFGSLELSGKRIAFLHGHQSKKFEQELESGNWDLFCYGHTHIAALQMRGSTMLLNPGAFDRVFRPTIAIVTLPDLTVERFDL
jgi:putative phosphoesterase